MHRIAKHIVFAGRVQGVGFRFTALNRAARYELTGQVRNLPDGTVEMIVQGYPDDIDQCIRDINDTYQGNITSTTEKEIAYEPGFSDFKITF